MLNDSVLCLFIGAAQSEKIQNETFECGGVVQRHKETNDSITTPKENTDQEKQTKFNQ